MTWYEANLPVIYLKPAQLYIGEKPAVVITVLGSCVSVTMFNRRLRIAAICHALLPSCRIRGHCPDYCLEKMKYVHCVIPEMIERMLGYGVRPGALEVKLFGGAGTLNGNGNNNSMKEVGRQNIEAARKIIQVGGLNLTTSDTGGSSGRKIVFYTHTGEILLKRLSNKE